MLKSPGITLRATNAMILSAGLLLLSFASASCNVGYWDCMTNGDLDNLGFVDRLSTCYSSCYQMGLSHNNDDDGDDGCDFPNQEPQPEYRLTTGSNPGSVVMCWPSKGGIYRLANVHNVQRQFLGLDRRIAKLLRPKVSADVEDAFCNQRKRYTSMCYWISLLIAVQCGNLVLNGGKASPNTMMRPLRPLSPHIPGGLPRISQCYISVGQPRVVSGRSLWIPGTRRRKVTASSTTHLLWKSNVR